jgi:hypothetical protein
VSYISCQLVTGEVIHNPKKSLQFLQQFFIDSGVSYQPAEDNEICLKLPTFRKIPSCKNEVS